MTPLLAGKKKNDDDDDEKSKELAVHVIAPPSVTLNPILPKKDVIWLLFIFILPKRSNR